MWSDEALFLLLSCGAIGIVSVVMWDTLFPNRRDVFVLGPLPLATRVQSAGRLCGLLTLFALFAVGLNAIPASLFPLVSAGTITGIPRAMAGHAITVLAADSFVFFGLTMLQGMLIVATSRRAAERLAPMIQTGAVVMLLLGLLFFGPLRQATVSALAERRPGESDPALVSARMVRRSLRDDPRHVAADHALARDPRTPGGHRAVPRHGRPVCARLPPAVRPGHRISGPRHIVRACNALPRPWDDASS